jgi:hypothetical protein
MSEATKRRIKLSALARQAARVISNYYAVIAFKSKFLPLPERLEYYSRYNADIAEFEHYDFHPRPTDTARVHAIWIADLFTPATFYTAFRKMGKVDWRDMVMPDDDPLDWIESTRKINSGGWRNLGFVSRTRGKFFRHTILRDLPEEFKYARFQILSITPSLSALVGCFYFDDSAKESYNDIARLHLLPYGIPRLDGTISIREPHYIKLEILQNLREKWRNRIAEFLSHRFGTFLASYEANLLPTIDLVEFSQTEVGRMHTFLLDHSDTWRCPDSILRWASGRSDPRPQRHTTVFYFEDELDQVDLKIYGDNGADSLIAKVSRSIESNWTFEAIHSLLVHYEGFLSRRRDENFRPITRFGSARRFVRAERAREMADVQLISEELKDEKFQWLTTNMIAFERVAFFGDKLSLKDILPKNMRQRAERVNKHQRNISSVRQALNESFAIFQMAQLTKRSLYTAIISSLITLVALLVAILSNRDLARYITSAIP